MTNYMHVKLLLNDDNNVFFFNLQNYFFK